MVLTQQKLSFNLLAKKDKSRAGILKTAHGEIKTPVFMPVGTQSTIKALTWEQLENSGAQMVLANTYHLHLRPGEDLIAKAGGLHKWASFDKPFLTDSGGFQIFSQARIDKCKITDEGAEFIDHHDGSKHFIGPRDSIRIQHKLGADIIMAFDHCPAGQVSYAEARDAMERTHRWAEECVDEHKRLIASAGHCEERSDEANPKRQRRGDRHVADAPRDDDAAALRHCEPKAKQSHLTGRDRHVADAPRDDDAANAPRDDDAVALRHCEPKAKQSHLTGRDRHVADAPRDDRTVPALFLIVQGGIYKDLRAESAKFITSLEADGYAIGGVSVGESREDIDEIVKFTADLLPEDKARYLMGIGTHEDIVKAVEAGIDMFDCVMPTRIARHGSFFAADGKRELIKAERYKEDFTSLVEGCKCYSCQNHHKAYLRHLWRVGESTAGTLLSIHNLYYLQKLAQDMRQEILAN